MHGTLRDRPLCCRPNKHFYCWAYRAVCGFGLCVCIYVSLCSFNGTEWGKKGKLLLWMLAAEKLCAGQDIKPLFSHQRWLKYIIDSLILYQLVRHKPVEKHATFGRSHSSKEIYIFGDIYSTFR